MVTRDDIQLGMFPAESCCNCGFVSKFVCDSDGKNGEHDLPLKSDFERFHGLDEHDDAVWQGRRIAHLQCWMRRGFLEQEATGGSSRVPHVAEKTLAALHKDRSKESGDDYCAQFTPWVRHLDFKEHWEERKVYLLERDRKRFEEDLEGQRRRWQLDLETSRKESEDGWNTRVVWVGIVGLILAAAQVVAAIIASGTDVTVNYPR